MAQLAHHDPLGDAEVGHLLDYLATISDPESSAGGDIRWWRSWPWPPPC